MLSKHTFAAVGALRLGPMMAFAAPIVIDGSLADWGVTVADNNKSMFTFNPAVDILGSFQEDQSDSAGDGGFLGPNYGGQNYDGELLAVTHEGTRLLVALVSGQRPDNGAARFAPGDIRIETSGGTYWLEVGGGSGDKNQTRSAIATGAAGTTYVLDSSGFTTSSANAAPTQTAGSIWMNVTELLDPIAPKEPTQFAIKPASVNIGAAEYVFTRDAQSGEHSVMELAFDATWFGGETIESIHWRPACGNDELDVPVNFTPEPASLALLVVGGLTLARQRGRKR